MPALVIDLYDSSPFSETRAGFVVLLAAFVQFVETLRATLAIGRR
jgi:hypothetical protein